MGGFGGPRVRVSRGALVKVVGGLRVMGSRGSDLMVVGSRAVGVKRWWAQGGRGGGRGVVGV